MSHGHAIRSVLGCSRVTHFTTSVLLAGGAGSRAASAGAAGPDTVAASRRDDSKPGPRRWSAQGQAWRVAHGKPHTRQSRALTVIVGIGPRPVDAREHRRAVRQRGLLGLVDRENDAVPEGGTGRT